MLSDPASCTIPDSPHPDKWTRASPHLIYHHIWLYANIRQTYILVASSPMWQIHTRILNSFMLLITTTDVLTFHKILRVSHRCHSDIPNSHLTWLIFRYLSNTVKLIWNMTQIYHCIIIKDQSCSLQKLKRIYELVQESCAMCVLTVHTFTNWELITMCVVQQLLNLTCYLFPHCIDFFRWKSFLCINHFMYINHVNLFTRFIYMKWFIIYKYKNYLDIHNIIYKWKKYLYIHTLYINKMIIYLFTNYHLCFYK